MHLSLDDVLAKLQGLPPEQQAQIDRLIEEGTGHLPWLPNPGPQHLAFDCDADELFYGGQAGPGKTDLLIGLSLTAHRRSLILRRTNKEAQKLVDRYQEILGTRDGWNSQLGVWRFQNRLIEIGGCQLESDRQKYKGTPRDLYCVGRGTPVLMADGSYQAVETLRVGDSVQTLEGPHLLQRIYPLQRKRCVEITARDLSGRVIARQVQSESHAVLCEKGWISAVDLDASCASMKFRESGKRKRLLSGRYSSLSTLRSASSDRWQRMVGLLRRYTDRLCDAAMHAFYWQSVPGNDCVWFAGGNAIVLQPPGWFDHGELSRLSRQSDAPTVGLHSGEHDAAGVASSSLRQGLSDHCSFGSHRYGGRTRLARDPSTDAGAGPQCLLLLADVEQPIPIHSRADGEERTQTRIGRVDTYVHPYTGETRRVDSSGSVLSATFEIVPVGVRDVFDLQVAEVNHYITRGGFANKNCFDEIPDFTESQYKFIIGWLRTTFPGQRCRIVAAGNPPTTAEGLWVIDYWGPWLNPKHPRPAQEGELRWYAGNEEVSGPGEYDVDGKKTKARSRTFIRGELADNPDLAATDYDSVLANMPEHLRHAYRGGHFDKSMRDSPWQVIPTEWVQDAFTRWRPDPPQGIPMVAIGVDPAAGGPDRTVLAPRHDWWYSELIAVPGVATPLGRDVAGLIVTNRRNNAHISLDMGGGYGGAVYECLIDNIDPPELIYCYNGSEASKARSKDGKLGFANKRAEAYWKFREALDPSQPNGSAIALPPDQELLAELTVVTFQSGPRGIAMLTKDSKDGDSVRKRLGRSPDKADAVVMAWAVGDKLVPRGGTYGTGRRFNPPKVNLGRRRQR